MSEFRLRRWAPAQFLSYLLLRSVVMVVDMFPPSMAPKLGDLLGDLIRCLDRKHVRIAVKNLERSPGVVPSGSTRKFIRRVYRHLGLGFVEMLMMPRLIQRGRVAESVRFRGLEFIDRALAGGRGVIMTIAHQGNWELAGLAVTKLGYRLNSLVRPIENPWVDRYLDRFRTSTGQETISKYGAMGSMIRALRRNEMLVIQVDQDARSSGVLVDFFGRPASTQRSAALLALKYGTPILPADIYREGGLNHCVIGEPLRPEDFAGVEDPVRALTQAYTSRLETYIRRHPEQWFWVHDRWKSAERMARKKEGATPA
jgi:KDO2-lipid IV(A) lauroyltransferase